MASNIEKEDKADVTFEESARIHECKTLQLLLLHCIRQNVKHFCNYSSQGNILFVQETEDTSHACVIHKKYKNSSNRITQSELLANSGEFSIMRCLQSAHSPPPPDFSSSSVSGVNFVIFVNGTIDDVEFLVKVCPKVPFLNAGAISNNVFKVDIDSFLKCYNRKNGCSRKRSDGVYGNVYLFVNQVDIKDLDEHIEMEIESLFASYHLVNIDLKMIARRFDEFVRSFYGCHSQSKQDIASKLSQIFISKYEISFTQDWFRFYTCPEKSIWNNIVRDKTVTVVDWDSEVVTFLKQYVGSELKTYGENVMKWDTPLSHKSKSLFFKNHVGSEIVFGKYEHIRMTDVYRYLWLKNYIPLLVQADNRHSYENILKIMQGFTCSGFQIIIIRKEVLPLSYNIAGTFLTLCDISTKHEELVLNQKVSLQRRTNVQFSKLVDKSMFQHVKSRDVIHILSKNYRIGNECQSLPTFYADRQLYKVILKLEVVNEVNEDIFVIHNRASCASLLAERLGAYDSDRVFITQSGFVEKMEKLTDSERTVHHLLFEGEDWFEWKESCGDIRNIRQYRRFDLPDCYHPLHTALEFTIDNYLNHAHILSGCSGIGKSTLTSAIALALPNDVWVMIIILNQHKDYFDNIRLKANLTATDHLSYFYNDILKRGNCTNIKLTNAVYQRFFARKKIVVLLDGYDDVFACYKSEVAEIVKSLQKEMYSVWITTSPYEAPYLEEKLGCLSNNLMRLRLQEQKDLLVKYFTDITKDDEINANNPKLIITEFVEKLLESAKVNFNDENYKFTGLPLHLKLLADAVNSQLKTSLRIGTVDVKHKFDLLYFYGEFTNRLFGTLCSKYSNFSKEIHQFLYGYQKLLALEVVFHRRDLYKFDIRGQLAAHYQSKTDVIQMFQQEGLIEIDANQMVAKFEHRIHAEYLAAQWLSENLQNSDCTVKETVDILLKRRFHHPLHYKYLFRIFDHILAKECPLHMAIMCGKIYEAEIILNASTESANAIDKGGRTALHIAALYGVPYSKRHDDDVIDVYDELVDVIVNFPNFKDANRVDSILGYSALDYAIASKSLAIANAICSKLEDLTINVDINPSLLKMYLARCVRTENYKPLLRALLKNDICAKLLNNQLKEYSNVDIYYSNLDYDDSDIENNLRHFMMQFSENTISSLLKSLNMKSSKGFYCDIRLAAAFGSTENIFELLFHGAKINHMGNYSLTPLHSAILHERVETVNVLLSKGASIDIVDMNGNTPLHLACRNSSTIFVKTLLLKGADINRQNDNGDAPLHYALKHNCAGTAELLLPEQNYQILLSSESREHDDKKRQHLDINIQNDDRDTYLLLALKHKLSSIALKLLHHNADVNIVNNRGYSSLHFAAEVGMVDVVLELIYNCLDINRQNNYGETPILLAVKNKHAETTKLLLSTGANPNIADNRDGYFPLHFASEAGEDEIALDLINRAAKIDSRTGNGSTPLSHAIIYKRTSMAQLLLSKGANPHIIDKYGCTYLHHAVQEDARKIATLLIKKGVDTNIQNNQSRTALMLALCENQRMAKVLLGADTDVTKEDKDGRSYLHYAAKADNTDVIAEMLNKGIEVDKRDNRGGTPAMEAAEQGHVDALKLLLAKGANVNAVNNRGFSCLHYAVLSRDDEVIRALVNGNADISLQNNDGDIPLSLLLSSVSFFCFTTCKMLLVNEANVNTTGANGNSCLHLATRDAKNDLVRTLLIMGADINKKNSDGDAPLIIACRNCEWETVEILINVGADVDVADSTTGYTCLHYAISNSKRDVAAELVSKGADINRTDLHGITPLELAQKEGNLSLVNLLLPSEDFDREEKRDYLRLYCAAKTGNDHVILKIISLGLDINKPNEKGKTALLYAVKKQKLGTANILISHGADLSVQNKKGFSILHYAAENGYDDIVTEYIDRGLDVNKRNDDGETPLILAFQRKFISTLKLLLKGGSDFKLMGVNSMSCLHYAATLGLNDIINDFLDNGVNVNVQNQNGETPLLVAVESYKISTARLLLQNGADVNIPSEYGSYCLHLFSSLVYNESVVLKVLERGANIETQNSSGNTPLLIALEYGNLNVANQLLARGANVSIRNSDDVSCLDLAVERGFDDIVLCAISNGADINYKSDYFDDSPLKLAIRNTRINVAKLLLVKGADVELSCLRDAASQGWEDVVTLLMSKGLNSNHRCDYGDTPLSVAADLNKKSIVKYMLLNNKNSTQDTKGNSYLHYAARMGFEGIALDLIRRGCDVNAENNCDETPLLLAIKHGNTRIARILLDHGANGEVDSEGNSCLHHAASKGANDIVVELLRQGLEINKQNGNGNTPLMLAVDGRHTSTCTLLLSKGADPNIENRNGMTCLHFTAMRGAKNILLRLLKEDVDINKVNGKGASPLLLALENFNVAVPKLLLSRGVEVNSGENYHSSCLHQAAKIGVNEMVTAIIDKGCDVNKVPRYLGTAFQDTLEYKKHSTAKLLISKGAEVSIRGDNHLYQAINAGYDDMVLELINAGVDINKFHEYSNNFPLFYALDHGKINIAKLLIANNADVMLINNHGSSSLHYAAVAGTSDIALDLIKNGLDVNRQNHRGRTPLLEALQHKKYVTAKLLLDSGANTRPKDGDGCSCLHFAAQAGYDDIIVSLIEQGLDINSEDHKGKTAFLYALEYQRLSTAKMLLANGADWTLTGPEYSALHLAAKAGYCDVVLDLLRRGCDVNIQTQEGDTAVLVALAKRKTLVAKLLIDLGADTNIRNYRGSSCLHYAAKMGCDDILKDMLSSSIVNINKMEDDGNTPLSWALQNKNLSTAKLILANKADVSVINKKGYSCLHYAAEANFNDIIDELIAKGCDLDRQNWDGDTPLLLALSNKHLSTSKLLISKRANAKLKNLDNHSCLHLAVTMGDDDLVFDLIKQGLDIDAQDNKGNTPLHFALKNNQISIAILLLGYDADVRIQGEDGFFCLHHAAVVGADEVISALIDKGGCVNERNHEGYTPLLLALKAKKVVTAKLLLSHGADINFEDEKASCCLHYAAIAGDDDLIVRLLDEGFDIDKQNDVDDTPLMLALQHKNIKATKLQLSRGAAVATGENDRGFSYLHYAAAAGDESLVLHFLNAGADINKCNFEGETPLALAIKDKQTSTAKLLISKGAIVKPTCTNSNSLLHHVADSGFHELLKELLLDNSFSRSDVNVSNFDKQTPLHYAVTDRRYCNQPDVERQMATVKALLDGGVNINFQDTHGRTALHCVTHVCTNDDPSDEKANYDVFTKAFYKGATALLLENHADVTVKDNEGRTPLELAMRNGNDAAVFLIRQNMKRLEKDGTATHRN